MTKRLSGLGRRYGRASFSTRPPQLLSPVSCPCPGFPGLGHPLPPECRDLPSEGRLLSTSLAAHPAGGLVPPRKPARAARLTTRIPAMPACSDQVQDGAGHQGHQLRMQESGVTCLTCTHMHTHTPPVHTPAHAPTGFTCTHTCTQTPAHTQHLYTHSCTPTNTCTHPHIACTHTHTPHLYTHAHPLTCTHTPHLYTHTPASSVHTPTPTLTLFTTIHTCPPPHTNPTRIPPRLLAEATVRCRALAHTAHRPRKLIWRLKKGRPGDGQSAWVTGSEVWASETQPGTLDSRESKPQRPASSSQFPTW